MHCPAPKTTHTHALRVPVAKRIPDFITAQKKGQAGCCRQKEKHQVKTAIEIKEGGFDKREEPVNEWSDRKGRKLNQTEQS